ncbi:MAG: glycogen synthase [Patescibacteria group bacterium]
MKVAFIASECTPLAKVGGLGDVIGALPKALAELEVEPIILLPYYRSIEKYKPTKTDIELETTDGDGKIIWSVFETVLPETAIRVLLLRHPDFWIDEVYDSPNDPFRFASFSIAAAALAQKLKVNVVHCHDWHTALASVVLKGRGIPTVITIHNVHPGTGLDQISSEQLGTLGIDTTKLAAAKDDRSNSFSLLAQGVAAANFITTVSPTHAEEIKAEAFGGSLAELFRRRSKDLEGIVNGIDVEVFNPVTDSNIAENYSAENLTGKTACRQDLERAVGWEHSDAPILGVVTRLTNQKGLDLIASILPDLAAAGTRVIILGTGEEAIESKLTNLAAKYADNLKALLRFDAVLAQKIYAGSDMFLMPSRFEPCGLGQMIAMRYGTLPVVNKTGGLADTVIDNQTGFVLEPLSAKNLLTTIERALAVWHDHSSWRTMQLTAMKQDFSWTKSAKRYIEIYKKLV